MSKNILFITEQTFKDRTGASNAIDGKQLFPMIKVAQDMYIMPTLGSTLYNRLQTAVDIDNLTANEKELIDDYLTDALIWYTMSMLPMTMGYQLFSKGFLQKTAEESNAPSRSDLELLEGKYKSMAEYYNTRMIKYLQQNYLNFYEYINVGAGFDVILPENRAYTCPIYLGDMLQPDAVRYVNSATGYKNVKIEYYTATAGLSTFNLPILEGKSVLSVTRAGLTKVVTNTTTVDTNKIQINNSIVTLPTGDVTEAGELFTFLYV